jgi:hypothetical protein
MEVTALERMLVDEIERSAPLRIETILDIVHEWIDEVDNYDEHSWAANLQDYIWEN